MLPIIIEYSSVKHLRIALPPTAIPQRIGVSRIVLTGFHRNEGLIELNTRGEGVIIDGIDRIPLLHILVVSTSERTSETTNCLIFSIRLLLRNMRRKPAMALIRPRMARMIAQMTAQFSRCSDFVSSSEKVSCDCIYYELAFECEWFIEGNGRNSNDGVHGFLFIGDSIQRRNEGD